MQGLLAELAQAKGGLSRVICHGDTHGFNNHIATNADGAKSAVFFDFDDAGPGFLAYDLCVMPWSYLTRKSLKEPGARVLEQGRSGALPQGRAQRRAEVDWCARHG